MEKSRIYLIIIFCLLALNGVLLFFLFHRPPHPPRPDLKEMLEHELKFNPDQQKQLESLLDEHEKAMEEIRDFDKNVHDKMWDLFKTNPNDTAQIHIYVDQIGEQRKKIEFETMLHFTKIHNLCNDEQKVKFDKVLQHMLEGMKNPERR